jgi:hypothetical protein
MDTHIPLKTYSYDYEFTVQLAIHPSRNERTMMALSYQVTPAKVRRGQADHRPCSAG